MSTGEKQVDALVIGAGPTGLAMGIELARQGVRCRIIDKAPGPSQTSKALGVQARTLEYLERIGVADAAVAAGRAIHGVNVFSEGKRIVHLGFDAIPSRFHYVLILPQSETERLLTERLAGLGVVVERGVELAEFTQVDDGVEAVLRRTDREGERRVRVRWLLGCDGAHSTVRHLLGVPFSGMAFEETFSLADVRVESSLPDDELSIYLHRGDILAFFPMTGGERRFRMVIQRREEPTADPEPTVEESQKASDDYGPKGTRISDPIWMSRFRISQRQAEDYRRGNVFLLGDAAHIHSPMGGQGMNTGIQDAANLGWKLALVASGRGRAGLLDSFQAERHPVGETLLRATGAFTRVVMLRNPVAEGVRDRVAALLTSFDAVQDRIRSSIAELGVNYRRSPIVDEDKARGLGGMLAGWLHADAGPRAGDRAPDGPVIRAAGGAPGRLFELLTGTRHTLLLLCGVRLGQDDVRRRAELLQAAMQAYAGLIAAYAVVPGSAAPQEEAAGAPVLLDPDGALHRAYTAEDETLCLVRPDGYLAYRSRPVDAARLSDYLKRIFV